MHVLVLPSWFPTARAPTRGAYFYHQLRALQHAGHRVGVIYPEHHSLRHFTVRALPRHLFQTRWHLEHRIPVLRHRGWNLLSKAPGSYAVRIRIAERLGRRYAATYGRPDVVHALSAQWAGGAAARLATRWNCPMALTEHFSGFMKDTLFPEQRRWARTAFDRANACAAVSPALRTALHEQSWCDASHVRLIPNPVDFSFFTPCASRPDPPPVICASVGRMVPGKGFDLLLRAIAAVRAAGHDIHLHLAGSGPENAALRDLARTLNIRPHVTFHGRLTQTEVRNLLQQTHLYVLASHHETFGIPVVEALACGCAVLATRCGGPEYVLSKHVLPDASGHLVAPGSVAALHRGLDHMICTLSASVSAFPDASHRAKLHNQFSYDTFVSRTTALYQAARQRVQ